MKPRAMVLATALGALAALLVAVGIGPAPATAEQASQPSSTLAGGLDAGRYHSCAIVPTARLRCWGYGGDGALGHGDLASIGDDESPAAAGPVNVGLGRTVSAVGAGTVHTCALLDGGAVRCWGFGGNGRLGYGDVANIGDDEEPATAGPVDLGAGRSAKIISAGRAHTCAVLDDDSLRCWGFNFDGRLGLGHDDSVGDDELPGSVGPVMLGAGRTARTVTSGDSHTCVLLDDGNVRCFGYGATGTLGYASTGHVGDDETPDLIGPVDLGAGRTAVAIAAGDFHNCAVLDNGSVRCWGFGGDGALGYGSMANVGDDETPAAAGPVELGAGRTAKAITAGDRHSCALLDNGSVRCWGMGANGQLGYGATATVGDDETPGSAGPVELGAGRSAVAITAGGDHTCARLDDDGVRCWGRGLYAELGSCGLDNVGDDETPASRGPVDLGVPGVPGVGCPAAISPPPPPPPPAAVPAPSVEQPATPPAPAGDTFAEAQRREAARAAALRACRATVTRRAKSERLVARRMRRGPARVAALRAVVTRASRRRQLCLTKYARTPGRVTTLSARRAARPGAIVLAWRAPGSDGSRPPAARGYLVKQSPRPIRSARDFARAQTLCSGNCHFAVGPLNAAITMTVTDLRRRATYYYAISARDNVSGRLGSRSKPVSARTR